MNQNDLLVYLKSVLWGKIIFVGIGNALRGDDGLGSKLVEKLRHLSSLRTVDPPPDFFNVGEVTENYMPKIVAQRPDTILLLDAVQLGAAPGTIRFVRNDEIGEYSFSTHGMSLRLAIQYLQNETGAQVFVLGVQPQSVEFVEAISETVENSLTKIIQLFEKAL